MTKFRYSQISGEDLFCDNPWFQNTYGFSNNTATCSYYRYFESMNSYEIRPGSNAQFIAGFNIFNNTITAGTLSNGVSSNQTWTIPSFQASSASN